MAFTWFKKYLLTAFGVYPGIFVAHSVLWALARLSCLIPAPHTQHQLQLPLFLRLWSLSGGHHLSSLFRSDSIASGGSGWGVLTGI